MFLRAARTLLLNFCILIEFVAEQLKGASI
jgi:hypothetical protein